VKRGRQKKDSSASPFYLSEKKKYSEKYLISSSFILIFSFFLAFDSANTLEL